MDPPGPVVIFNTSILTAGRSEKSLMTRFNDEYSNPIILTCNTSENYSITWDLSQINLTKEDMVKLAEFLLKESERLV